MEEDNIKNDALVIKRARDYKKNGYNIKDSSFAFLLGGYISPFFALLIISLLISFICAFGGFEYDVLIKNHPIDIIILLCAEIGFAGYFIFVQFISKNRKEFKNCVGISFKTFDVLMFIIVVVLAVIMALLTSQFIDLINHGLSLVGYSKSTDLPFKINSIGNLFLGLFAMALVPAICEEFVFRGILLGGMLNKAKTNKAKVVCVIISALFFALIHESALQLVYPFIMGLVFGFIYMYTGNLLYNMILHFVSNGFVVVINYYYAVNNVSQEVINYNAGYILSTIAQLIFALLIAFGAICLIRLISKNKSQFCVSENEIEKLEAGEMLISGEIITEEKQNEIIKQNEFEKLKEENDYRISKIVYIIGLAVGLSLILYDLISNIAK